MIRYLPSTNEIDIFAEKLFLAEAISGVSWSRGTGANTAEAGTPLTEDQRETYRQLAREKLSRSPQASPKSKPASAR